MTPEQRVEENLGLVWGIVHRHFGAAFFNSTHLDVFQEGTIGLWEAACKYDESREVPFRGYAYGYVVNRCIDCVRKMDWTPRAVRKLKTRILNSRESLTNKLHRQPTEAEQAEALNMDLEEYYEAVELCFTRNFIPSSSLPNIEDLKGASTAEANLFGQLYEQTDERGLKAETCEKLWRAVNTLNEREQRIIDLHYCKGLLLQDVAVTLGVSAGRVAQLHQRILKKLTVRLRNLHLEGTSA